MSGPGASSGACLGQHLRHIVINGHQSAVLHKSVKLFLDLKHFPHNELGFAVIQKQLCLLLCIQCVSLCSTEFASVHSLCFTVFYCVSLSLPLCFTVFHCAFTVFLCVSLCIHGVSRCSLCIICVSLCLLLCIHCLPLRLCS